MLELVPLGKLVESLGYRPHFVTVSGAHLYGFPSPDSDIDLRGAHLLPLEEVIGLHLPAGTLEKELEHQGREVELVSHDLGKYLRLLVKNNGYVLEQILSPLVVMGGDFLARLRPLAVRCITRYLYHHYRGFLQTQLRQLAREDPRRVKTVLYAYRVVLTGIHLLRTGEVEANLPRLARTFALDFLDDSCIKKRPASWRRPPASIGLSTSRSSASWRPSWAGTSDWAHQASTLPERMPASEINEFLVGERLTGR